MKNVIIVITLSVVLSTACGASDDKERAKSYSFNSDDQSVLIHVEEGATINVFICDSDSALAQIGARAAAARAAQTPQYPRGVMPNLGNIIGRGEDNPLRKYTTTYNNGRTTISISKIAKELHLPESVVRTQVFGKNGIKLTPVQLRDLIVEYNTRDNPLYNITYPASEPYGLTLRLRNSRNTTIPQRQFIDKNAAAVLVNAFSEAFNGQGILLKVSNVTTNNQLTDFFNGAGAQINAYTTHIWPSLGNDAMRQLIGRASDNLWEANGINVTNHGKTVTAKKGNKTTISSDDLVTQIETLLYAPNISRLTVMDEDGKVRYVYANTNDLMQGGYGDYRDYLGNYRNDGDSTLNVSSNRKNKDDNTQKQTSESNSIWFWIGISSFIALLAGIRI